MVDCFAMVVVMRGTISGFKLDEDEAEGTTEIVAE